MRVYKMPKQRYWKEEKVKIAELQIVKKCLYIKNNNKFIRNSQKYKYFLDNQQLFDNTKIKLRCPICNLVYTIWWKRVKNSGEIRLCQYCQKRRDNNFYRKEWYTQKSINDRVKKAKENNLKNMVKYVHCM